VLTADGVAGYAKQLDSGVLGGDPRHAGTRVDLEHGMAADRDRRTVAMGNIGRRGRLAPEDLPDSLSIVFAEVDKLLCHKVA
jgi:hypothetical protein